MHSVTAKREITQFSRKIGKQRILPKRRVVSEEYTYGEILSSPLWRKTLHKGTEIKT